MSAIFRREFKSYFTTPIGYIQIAILALFAGMSFQQVSAVSKIANLSYVFSSVFLFFVISLTFITMRLFSEEKRQKTDQLLLTSPVSLIGIVLGKFFAAYLVMTISLGIFLIFALIIAFQVSPDWAVIIGNLLGLLLIGGMIISIGLFISSLTESQLIAALLTLGITLAFLLINNLESVLPKWDWIATALSFISISTRYYNFVSGLIRYDDIIFFVTLQALFVFLTVRVLDSKRWG